MAVKADHAWLVVICREGETEATPFASEADALAYFDMWAAQWSDSYLCEVKRGPLV